MEDHYVIATGAWCLRFGKTESGDGRCALLWIARRVKNKKEENKLKILVYASILRNNTEKR